MSLAIAHEPSRLRHPLDFGLRGSVAGARPSSAATAHCRGKCGEVRDYAGAAARAYSAFQERPELRLPPQAQTSTSPAQDHSPSPDIQPCQAFQAQTSTSPPAQAHSPSPDIQPCQAFQAQTSTSPPAQAHSPSPDIQPCQATVKLTLYDLY
jgi:hypothetical protein